MHTNNTDRQLYVAQAHTHTTHPSKHFIMRYLFVLVILKSLTTWLSLFHLLESITYPTQAANCLVNIARFLTKVWRRLLRLSFYRALEKYVCVCWTGLLMLWIYRCRPCSFAAHLDVQQTGRQLSWIRRSLNSLSALGNWWARCKNGRIRVRIIPNKQRFGTQTQSSRTGEFELFTMVLSAKLIILQSSNGLPSLI